jgi:hypothetical protein
MWKAAFRAGFQALRLLQILAQNRLLTLRGSCAWASQTWLYMRRLDGHELLKIKNFGRTYAAD